MKKWSALMVVAALAAAVAVPIVAQEGEQMSPEMMKAMMPGEHHQHLARLAGEYDMKGKAWMAPGAAPTEFTGTRTAKMIMGGRHLEETLESQMMGMPFKGMGLYSYDNAAGEYVTNWIDNMSTGVITSHGTCSEEGWTFQGTHLDPSSGEKVSFTSKIRPVENGFLFEWFEGDQKTMEITYTKK